MKVIESPLFVSLTWLRRDWRPFAFTDSFISCEWIVARVCSEGLSGTWTFHIGFRWWRSPSFLKSPHAGIETPAQVGHLRCSLQPTPSTFPHLSAPFHTFQHLSTFLSTFQHPSRFLRSFQCKGQRMAQAHTADRLKKVTGATVITQTGPKCDYTCNTDPKKKEVDLQVYIVWLSVERSASYLLRPGRGQKHGVLQVWFSQYPSTLCAEASVSRFEFGIDLCIASPRPHNAIQGFLLCCSWSSWAF